jgi:hypothetical protein
LRTTTNNNKEKLKVIENTHPRDDYRDYVYDDNDIHIVIKKQRLKTGELTNSRDTTLSQPYRHWMAAELVSCNTILPNPVGNVYVVRMWMSIYLSLCVCMGGGLTLGLAAKHKL